MLNCSWLFDTPHDAAEAAFDWCEAIAAELQGGEAAPLVQSSSTARSMHIHSDRAEGRADDSIRHDATVRSGDSTHCAHSTYMGTQHTAHTCAHSTYLRTQHTLGRTAHTWAHSTQLPIWAQLA